MIDYCDHRWYESESTVPSKETNGPHQCIKDISHVKDITDDDHKCCCGAKLWESA